MNDLVQQFQYKQWANLEILDSIEALAVTANSDDARMALRILNHTYVVDSIFRSRIIGATPEFTGTNTEATPAVEELRSSVASMDAWFIEFVGQLSPSRLDRQLHFTFTDGDAGCMSVREILTHLIVHGAYHRGAAGRLLLQNSVPPPKDLFTRFLHELEPDRRQH